MLPSFVKKTTTAGPVGIWLCAITSEINTQSIAFPELLLLRKVESAAPTVYIVGLLIHVLCNAHK